MRVPREHWDTEPLTVSHKTPTQFRAKAKGLLEGAPQRCYSGLVFRVLLKSVAVGLT